MLRREQGWAFNEGYNDVWRLEIDQQGQRRYFVSPKYEARVAYRKVRYINNVTGEWQEESPPIFRGGLLADAMGL